MNLKSKELKRIVRNKISCILRGMMFLKKREGFSIIELVVTVTIIAILAGVGVGTYFSSVEKAFDAKKIQDFETVNKIIIATDLFLDEDDKYVHTRDDLLRYFEDQGYTPSQHDSSYCYIYLGSAVTESDPNQFILATWSDVDSTLFPKEEGLIFVSTPLAKTKIQKFYEIFGADWVKETFYDSFLCANWDSDGAYFQSGDTWNHSRYYFRNNFFLGPYGLLGGDKYRFWWSPDIEDEFYSKHYEMIIFGSGDILCRKTLGTPGAGAVNACDSEN